MGSGFDSRSAVVHKAVKLLQAVELGDAYEDAWRERATEDAGLWELTSADGVDN